MKKWTATALLACLVVSGCGNAGEQDASGAGGKKPVEITFTIFDDGLGVDKKLVDEYNQSQNEVKVTYKPVPNSEYKDRLTTWLAASDDSLDVIGLDIVWISEFAKAGWIQPLDPLMDDAFKTKVTTGLLKGPSEAMNVNGAWYALPWNSTAGMLYYRKDILEKEGLKPPQTWDELYDQAKQLGQKYNMNGYVGQFKQHEAIVTNALEIMESYNGHFLDGSGKVVVNSPENLKAMQMMLKLKDVMPAGVNTYVEKESQEAFLNGNAVFLRSWNSAWPLVEKEGSAVKGKVDVSPLPKGDNGKPASTLGGWNLGITKTTKHPKESFEFMKWLMDAKQQKVKVIEGGRLPTDVTLYQDQEIISKNPSVIPFYQVLINGVSRPKSANYGKVSETIQQELSLAFNNKKTPEQALADMQKKLEEIQK